MILSDVLTALAGNQNVNITLIDSDENALITFNAAGHASVESDLGKRNVKKIKINTAQALTILIDDAAAEETPTEPTTDPVDPDPGTGEP